MLNPLRRHRPRIPPAWRGCRASMATTALVQFHDADIYHRNELPGTTEPVFRGLNLRIGSEERWVLVGATGSGKTTLLQAIRGLEDCRPPRSIQHPFLAQLDPQRDNMWPDKQIAFVGPAGAAAGPVGGSAYLAERYEAFRDEHDQTLLQWLQAQTGADSGAAHRVSHLLELDSLLHHSVMNLSSGQSRRAGIARALLRHPYALALDEPFMGLDVASRAKISRLLGHLAREKAVRVLLALRPQDEMPAWATHVALLRKGSVTAGTRASLQAELDELARESVSRDLRSLIVANAARAAAAAATGEELVALDSVECAYFGRPVLQGIDWHVRAGERWALLGANGSGKTTLLAMITGDHPKAYANAIRLFGRPRGSGESVFDVQARIGHTSPELHAHMRRSMSVRDVMLSAWSEVPAARLRAPTGAQEEAAETALQSFVPELVPTWAETELGQLPTGTQRAVLLARALARRPPLVILDEPFQGMDEMQIERAKRAIDANLGPDQALIIVTHHENMEMPASVNRLLRLDQGRVVERL